MEVRRPSIHGCDQPEEEAHSQRHTGEKPAPVIERSRIRRHHHQQSGYRTRYAYGGEEHW
jgi:hypothetical protein